MSAAETWRNEQAERYQRLEDVRKELQALSRSAPRWTDGAFEASVSAEGGLLLCDGKELMADAAVTLAKWIMEQFT